MTDDLRGLFPATSCVSRSPSSNGDMGDVSVSNITFLQPVHVGDTVCCYTDVKRIGRTSITLDVEVWVLHQGQGEPVKVTDAEVTFVAVHEDDRTRQLATSGGKSVAPPLRNSRRTLRQQESKAM